MDFAYQRYLKGKHWQSFRRRYWASAKTLKACSACGAKDRPLDLHHVTYKRIGHERFRDVRPLCRGCHELVHFYVLTYPKVGYLNAIAAVKQQRKRIKKSLA